MTKKKQIRVLVVEDEPAHAEVIKHHLDDSGRMAVELATTLEDARRAMAANPPDIGLIDLNLPDGDALELLSAGDHNFPVLIMTAQGSEELAVEALKAGAQDYLVKSVATFERMPEFIEQSLREWRITREREEAIAALRRSKARQR